MPNCINRMIATRFFAAGLFAVGLWTAGCVDVTIPAEAGASGGGTVSPVGGGGTQENISAPDAGSLGLSAVDGIGGADEGPADVTVPPSCETHCDCPSGYDCINARCVLGAQPIYCCTHPQCPPGEPCYANHVAGICGE